MKKTSPLPSPSAPRPTQSTSSSKPQSTPLSRAPPTATGESRPQLRRNSRKSGSDEKLPASPGEEAESTTRIVQNLIYSDTSTSTESTEEEDNGVLADTSVRPQYGAASSPEALEVERLKQLVYVKMMAKQERDKASLSPKSSPGARTPGNARARRISPIKEESGSPTMSPSIDASFGSPLTSSGPETTSTESTESARTIRGSVPPTPSQQLPLRTPSYPFPYVPGTPRVWSSSFHQPFTNLSPTATTLQMRGGFPGRRESVASGQTSPSSISTCLPGAPHQENEDPRFPTPDLYECILLLNSEPGLDTWWSTVVRLAHEWFGAERASLSVPADYSDIENVPWAQKAAFNVNGRHDGNNSVDSGLTAIRTAWLDKESASRQKFHQEEDKAGSTEPTGPRRPKMEMRHSFAGHERQREAVEARKGSLHLERPAGPSRTASHAPRALARGDHPLRHMSPVSYDGASPSTLSQKTRDSTTFSDPEFSNMGDTGPSISLFETMKPLSHEIDPLIDNAGIMRILDRGKLVTLTRDYAAASFPSMSKATRRRSNTSPDSQRQADSKTRATPHIKQAGFQHDARHIKRTSSYEEYEQLPTSPWAQSPGPSPAIQHDATENPFFKSEGSVDEDSFNPSDMSEDYTKPIEAIGVDRASTITHIPLIHPILSQVLQGPEDHIPQTRPESQIPEAGQTHMPFSTDTRRQERRAPIAVLSILTSAVPFPQNWMRFLKTLAPHLATSFSNANQFTSMEKQASNMRRGRFVHNQVGMELGIGSLSGLMQLDFEPNTGASAPGSMTSPSDYSGRSRPSPGGSVLGTPGWDPAMAGFTRTSVTSTPAHMSGSEAVDSYFDTKKKIIGAKSSSSQRPAAIPKSPSPVEMRPGKKSSGSGNSADNEALTPKMTEQKASSQFLSHEAQDSVSANSPRRPTFKTSTSRLTDTGHRHHSLLHSYGADFSSTFQSLPATTTPRTPSGRSHIRPGSSSEQSEMLPPSSSLLRTIIDSLPVQIFTAAPVSGTVTWFNAKFLIYRTDDEDGARQVFRDPWHAIHPEDREDFLALWSKCLRTGQQLQCKLQLRNFHGEYRWFYVRAAPLKDKRQNIVHWIGTLMDFHDQHLAEINSARQQETAASEAKYRALANSSPQIVFAATRSKGVIFCNSQWVLYSGQTEAEATGLGFMDYVHPEDISKCRLPTVEADGSAVIDAPISIVADESRRSVSTSDMSQNSSETERLVSSPEGELGSPAATGMPQVRLSRLASTGILKISKDIDGRPSYSTEVRLQSKAGAYRWHLVRVLLAAPAVTSEQDEDTWYGTCTDINDHKLLEQTLKETMDAKTRFLSNMSHEIRTPLNGITGMVNFLIDSSLSAEQMEHVNIIRSSTEGLRDLINDILDLSKVEAGMITLTPHWFTVRELIEDVNDLTSGMAVDKGLDLNYVLDDDVPLDLKGDKFRIRQVLLNVVGNAIKFTDVGEVFVRCRIAEQQDGCTHDETILQFQVVDTGKGFTEKEAEFLFKRFSQIDQSSTRQHGGTGLGLAISMQLVELHGGKMKASSIPGKGSTFTFTVKFGVPSKDDHPESGSMTPSAATTPYQIPTPYATDGPPGIEKRFSSAYGSPGRPLVESPALSEGSHRSPGQGSSASSDPSIRTAGSVRSDRSSASSFVPDNQPMTLSLPGKSMLSRATAESARQHIASPSGPSQPLMYSTLVICPLEYSREAIMKHVVSVLPKAAPSQISARASLEECKQLFHGDDPVRFTHVVLNLRRADETMEVMYHIFKSPAYSTTAVVVMTDLSQKRQVFKDAAELDLNHLMHSHRLLFVFKPLKPSKIATFFDPRKERETAGERGQDYAQQAAVSQKQVFDDLKRRLGNRGLRVLLVEDNKINQTVLLKYLGKISIDVETVLDGVQCTDKVFAQDHGYYSIILCDLHMPNKDGYQTCREIRKWERRNKFPHLPIIALSANVLGDVYAKCVEAGFNSYVTKPVDFKVLSEVMTKFLDPTVKGQPHEFMKMRKGDRHQ